LPKRSKKETKKKSPTTVTLSKEQFDSLLNEIKELKEQVEVLKAKKELAAPDIPKRPIYYSLSRIEELKEQRRAELQAKIDQKMEKAIDMVLLDAKVNPPKRY